MAQRVPVKPVATTYDGDGYASATPSAFREFEATDTIPVQNIPTGIPAANIGSGSVDNTELGYLNGVTSALQTQLDGKQPLDAALTALSNALSDLADPGVDAIIYWDNTDNRFEFLTAGTGITIAGGTISASGAGAITRTIVVTSGSFTAGATALTDYVYLIAGAHTPTMPTAASNTNRYTLKNNHTANVTIGTTSSQTIDGSTTYVLVPGESVDLISDNSNWSIV
jgi:hypothetical protein